MPLYLLLCLSTVNVMVLKTVNVLLMFQFGGITLWKVECVHYFFHAFLLQCFG
jgi:hypothetical protein